ncbi:MAG: response regulator transcription factor, partial [Gammaproteobacteria bacterium]
FTEDLFEHGCRGVISRGELGRDLLKAVRAVAAGELWIGRSMLTRLLERASERRVEKTIQFATSLHSALTVRENTIASHAVRGLTNKEIARALSISDMTVKTHMSRILHKLGVARRQQLVFGTSDRQSL